MFVKEMMFKSLQNLSQARSCILAKLYKRDGVEKFAQVHRTDCPSQGTNCPSQGIKRGFRLDLGSIRLQS